MIENGLSINGIVMAGHQVASGQGDKSPYPDGSLRMQAPHLLARGFDIYPYRLATLNISIAPQVVTKIDAAHRFESVEWTDLHPPETFSFSACELIFRGETYTGWIYYPHPETKKTHFQTQSTLEVLTTNIPNIKYGDEVLLVVNRQEVGIAKA